MDTLWTVYPTAITRAEFVKNLVDLSTCIDNVL
jgi:hypothetical protein